MITFTLKNDNIQKKKNGEKYKIIFQPTKQQMHQKRKMK